MPISLPNFLQAEAKPYGPHDLLGSAIEGYKASRLPAQMKREEQRQAELVQKLQHGNYKAGLENEYLPHELQNKEIRSDIDTYYAGPTKAGELEALQRKNRLGEQYDEPLIQARIKELQDRAKHQQYAHLPQSVRVAQMIQGDKFDPASDETKRIIAGIEKIPYSEIDPASREENPLPQGAKSMLHWSPAAVTAEIKRQNEEFDKIETAKTIKSGVEDARQIIKAYPNMWKSLSVIMADPENKSKIAKVIGGLSDQNERTAAQQFVKIISSVVNRGAEQLGARGTNMRVKLLQQEKPELFNTPEGNNYIFDKIDEEIDPKIAREKDLLRVYGEYSLPRSYAHNKKPSKHLAGNNQQASLESALNANKQSENAGSTALVSIDTDEGPFDVPMDRVDAFMIKRKDINPKINLGGK